MCTIWRVLCQWGFRYVHDTGNSMKLRIQYEKIVFSQVCNLYLARRIVSQDGVIIFIFKFHMNNYHCASLSYYYRIPTLFWQDTDTCTQNQVSKTKLVSRGKLNLSDPGRFKLTRGNLKWAPFWNGSTLCHIFYDFYDIF